jgi:hypothetical protein
VSTHGVRFLTKENNITTGENNITTGGNNITTGGNNITTGGNNITTGGNTFQKLKAFGKFKLDQKRLYTEGSFFFRQMKTHAQNHA